MVPAFDRLCVVYTYSLNYPEEIPRTGCMAAGSLMLTIILAAMIYSALFTALEHQEKTALEIETVPKGSLASMIGTILATLVEVLIVLWIVGVVNGLLWHLKFPAIPMLPSLLLAAILLALIFAIIGYGLGNRAEDVRLVLAPTMITVLALWIISGGVNPVEAMAVTEFLSVLPTTAALRIMAKELVGLETLSTGANLIILGIWTAAIATIVAILKIGIGRRNRISSSCK